ncbi:fimbrial protein [Providencia sp. PROV257]|uniref:fimbrial protein n=1 Tax=Providencia sp. PROV257 TaxID=2949945 RepID=UPI00234AE654|nr:fimbrial protein [Providencia sp. PROV257]
MKKNVISTLFIASTALFISNAFATDGTINFTGEITDEACQLAAGSDALEVNLGKVSKAALPAVGSTTAATKFAIKLTGCPAAVTSASITFDGTPYSGDNQILALKAETGVATGVGIQLTDDTNTVVPLYTKSKSYTLQPTVENSLEFAARYIAKSASITSGPANSNAVFTVSYN